MLFFKNRSIIVVVVVVASPEVTSHGGLGFLRFLINQSVVVVVVVVAAVAFVLSLDIIQFC